MTPLYSKIRSELKTGDLLIWKTSRFKSLSGLAHYIYQKITGDIYAHVGLVLKEGNRVFVVEATPPAVRLFPLSMSGDFGYVPLELELNDKHIDFLLSDLGKKYSLWDLVRSLFKWSNSNNEFYCSEFCSVFYNQIGLLGSEDAGLTPDTLVESIVMSTGKFPIFVKNDKGNLDVV